MLHTKLLCEITCWSVSSNVHRLALQQTPRTGIPEFAHSFPCGGRAACSFSRGRERPLGRSFWVSQFEGQRSPVGKRSTQSQGSVGNCRALRKQVIALNLAGSGT